MRISLAVAQKLWLVSTIQTDNCMGCCLLLQNISFTPSLAWAHLGQIRQMGAHEGCRHNDVLDGAH